MGALMYRGTSTADPNTARSFKGRLLYIQPKQLPVDASGRGDNRALVSSNYSNKHHHHQDNRRQGGVPQTWSLIPPAMFVDLRLSTLQKLEVHALMSQGSCPFSVGLRRLVRACWFVWYRVRHLFESTARKGGFYGMAFYLKNPTI